RPQIRIRRRTPIDCGNATRRRWPPVAARSCCAYTKRTRTTPRLSPRVCCWRRSRGTRCSSCGLWSRSRDVIGPGEEGNPHPDRVCGRRHADRAPLPSSPCTRDGRIL
ncbi:hypothetical protein NHX12_015012, partial [Muraenolepis orangiensis]